MKKGGACKKMLWYTTLALGITAGYYYYKQGSLARPSEMVKTTANDAKKAINNATK